MAHLQVRSAPSPEPGLYDTVSILHDLPGAGSRYGAPSVSLPAGATGVVAHVLDAIEGGQRAYEVELCDEAGRTIGVHTLRKDEIRVVGSASRHREDDSGAA